MAKDKAPEKTAQTPEGQNAAPGIQVVAQYVKDFSFENPNAPESLVGGWPAPETNVQIFLKPQSLGNDAYECVIQFVIEAKKPGDGKTSFILDLSYAAVVLLKNVPAENHAPVVMVEVPKLLFPFARQIIADATASGGFPPLYLTPISFEQLYLNEVKRQQEQKAKQAAG